MSETTNAPAYRTTPDNRGGMPPGIPYIVGNEAAERFSFYGMQSILAIFLTQHLIGVDGAPDHMSKSEANEWQHDFIALCYLTPIFGALLSDWLVGKYKTILTLSLAYCAGHGVMALVDYPQLTGLHPRTMLWVALCLIALGAGGIKPCVSSHVGDQFGPGNKHLLPRVFGWFYFSINFGSMASMALIPVLLETRGPALAFGLPGILMAIATFVFWMGRNKFVHVPAGGSGFFAETFSRDGLRAVLNLAPLYLLLAPFWSLFDQTHSTWVYQAEELNLNFFGAEVLPAQLQVVNPTLVLCFIPLFSYVIYPIAGRFVTVTPLRKIGVGLFLTAPAFALIAWLQIRIDSGATPHAAWHLVAYALITAAEIMVSITALEFSYTQAPRKMKSIIMGTYFLSVTLGNKFTSAVNGYVSASEERGEPILQGDDYFWFFTYVMLGTAAVYVVWSQFYRGQTYIQGEEESEPVATVEAVGE